MERPGDLRDKFSADKEQGNERYHHESNGYPYPERFALFVEIRPDPFDQIADRHDKNGCSNNERYCNNEERYNFGRITRHIA